MTKPVSLPVMLNRVCMSGGFTLRYENDRPSHFVDSGYAVSLHPEREEHVSALLPQHVALGFLAGYVLRNRRVLSTPGLHLGAWLDNDVICLDIVTIVDDQAKALDLAVEHNQLAIFDLSAGLEIRTAVTR